MTRCQRRGAIVTASVSALSPKLAMIVSDPGDDQTYEKLLSEATAVTERCVA